MTSSEMLTVIRVITPNDVRASIKRAKRSLEKAAEEIVWQIEMEAWRTLGYRSWSAMREAEYGGAAFMVPAKQRPELVARIRAKGLTQQDIADTAGVHRRTVERDLNVTNAHSDAPPITNARGQQRPATYTPTAEKTDPVAAESYWTAAYKLLKAVKSVESLHMDDRFGANKETLLASNRSNLLQAHKKLTAICADLGVDTGAEPPICRDCGDKLVLGPPSRLRELNDRRIVRGSA